MSTEYAFNDYAELKATVADWLMRPDLESQIPQFIKMAEEFCNSNLRTREMVHRARETATARYISLPTDLRKIRNVQRTNDSRVLEFMALDEMDRYRADLASGKLTPVTSGPAYFSLVGDEMELAPSPTQDSPTEVEMIYYREVPRLENDSDTNWLLLKYPSILLYGTLIHSAPFLKEDERIATWRNMLNTSVASANESDADARFSGAPMMRRPSSFGV